MAIRQLDPDDKQSFFGVESLVFAGDEIDEEVFQRYCETRTFLGLFTDGVLVGYLLLRPGSEYSHLNRIGVHPDYQSQGHGRQLMEHALQVFRTYGSSRVGLYVGTKNEAAIHLYHKFGFEIAYESWHYILQVEQFENHKQVLHSEADIRELYIADIDQIMGAFPDLEPNLLLDWMTQPGPNLFLGLFDDDLKLFARFNPDFSGCFPFRVSDLTYVDFFVDYLIRNYKRDDRAYIRIAVDKHKSLAQRLEKAGYEQHHHLFKMELELD